jgi:hypothetical protein
VAFAVLVLAGVVGVAIAGGRPGDGASPPATARSPLNVAFVPRPSPWAVPSPTVDPATLEGAGALAATTIVIPPPRWLAGQQPAALTRLLTARVGGLGWRTDPYAK